jgi:hypothetical protein
VICYAAIKKIKISSEIWQRWREGEKESETTQFPWKHKEAKL